MSKSRRKAGSSTPRSSRWVVINGLLLLAVATSSVAVVQTSHQCRQAWASLQQLQSERWRMQEQWSRLLLQESALATHHRVEQSVSNRLDMRIPGPGDTRVVLR